jgi:hypothetical protein
MSLSAAQTIPAARSCICVRVTNIAGTGPAAKGFGGRPPALANSEIEGQSR